MTFKSSVMPGVRAFASSMRVKLSREPTRAPRASALFAIPSSSTQVAPRAAIGWRICPATGQLQQRWSFDDSQDPQSMGLAQLLQRAGRTLNLYVEARAA
ncbi:hypothetical protein [Pseudomonas gingeri]|uniref:hypothetical protein n=1 Tax=Pseudomonas gingeri TaxID=117681 RepID=UPI0015A4C048|nr:hypothetical protein [Pseudomonas gingeri]NVZ99606.1 hypothetical protein [Pseudomonas gingeri]NWA15372.1 hypothetical protein [Pseudomonas gingeri]NWA56599.1 hypothetical protein [Pseudomonas gingeri]NWA95093.1 hypothetical protein [Pseudomonas gingeri]NWB05175.1 hypothetical protein [Pseudomonas gingeri]